MALQIRRGLEADRSGVTPAEGELIYTTDEKKVYIGDGSTAGGVDFATNSALANVVEDVSPQLGGNLDLNGNNIVGTGNINIGGTITASGNINLGDGAGGDIISVGGEVSGGLVPTEDGSFDVGSSSARWNTGHFNSLNVSGQLDATNVNSNLVADDSTISYDKSTGNFTGNLTGQVTGDLTGSVFADDSTAIIDAQNKTITGDLTGNTEGYHTGDVSGSVFAIDSTVLVDSINGILVGTRLQTNVLENTTGDLRVEATGNTVKLSNDVQVQSTDAINAINLSRTESSGSIPDSTTLGRITFSKNDTDGSTTPFSIDVSKTYCNIFPNPTGTPDYTKFFQVYNNGKVQIGGELGGSGFEGMVREPNALLEVYGDTQVETDLTVLGSSTLDGVRISQNNITAADSNDNLRLSGSGTGTIELDVPVQTTVGAAGAATALPATPSTYFKINVGGTEYVVPAYAVS